MPTVTINEKRQITLDAETLAHLGLIGGGKISVEFLPDAKISTKRASASNLADNSSDENGLDELEG